MKNNRIGPRSFLMALAMVITLAVAWPCAAAAPAGGPAGCGLIGTWYGQTDSALRWMGVHTAGATMTQGEMLLDWLWIGAEYLKLGNQQDGYVYENVTRLSDGHGVWEQTGKGTYKYTWYAYGSDTSYTPDGVQPAVVYPIPVDNQPLYTVRVSGIARQTSCDRIDITYNYEIFNGFVPPQEMSGATPIGAIAGDAVEWRTPLTVVPPAP